MTFLEQALIAGGRVVVENALVRAQPKLTCPIRLDTVDRRVRRIVHGPHRDTAGTGDGRSIDVTVNLVSDLDQFEQHAHAEITGDDSDVDIDPVTFRERRCETTNGEPVDPRQLVAAAFMGRIRSIVVDGAGIIVAAGRKQPVGLRQCRCDVREQFWRVFRPEPGDSGRAQAGRPRPPSR